MKSAAAGKRIKRVRQYFISTFMSIDIRFKAHQQRGGKCWSERLLGSNPSKLHPSESADGRAETSLQTTAAPSISAPATTYSELILKPIFWKWRRLKTDIWDGNQNQIESWAEFWASTDRERMHFKISLDKKTQTWLSENCWISGRE